MPPCRRHRKEATPHCYWGVVNKVAKLHAVPREVVASKRQKNPPPARSDAREVEAVAAALKPKSPPPARVWTRGTWKRRWCHCGFGCHCGFALLFRSGGELSDLSGDAIDGENEPQRLSWLVFRDALNGPPTSWVLPRVSPPPSID